MDDLSDKRALCTLFSSAFYWASLFLAYWSSSLVVEEPLSFRLKGCALLGSAVMLGIWFLVMRAGKGKLFDGTALMILPFGLLPMAGISSLLLAFPVGHSLPYAIHYVFWFLFGCGAAFALVHMAYGIFRIKTESVFSFLPFRRY